MARWQSGPRRTWVSRFDSNAETRKDFTGAGDVSVVNSRMGKWVLSVAAGFLGCCLSVSAQTTQRQQTDLLALNQSAMMSGRVVDLNTLNDARYGFQWLTLGDARAVSLSNGYSWVEPVPIDFFPLDSVDFAARTRTSPAAELDSDYKTVKAEPKLIDYVHGEVGALYGTSVGSKFGREVEAGYILGEIGNDKYQINVGAFYEHSTAHFPRH